MRNRLVQKSGLPCFSNPIGMTPRRALSVTSATDTARAFAKHAHTRWSVLSGGLKMRFTACGVG